MQSDERPFDRGQDDKGEDDGERQPQRRMHPERRPVGHLHGEHKADHDVADNDDGEIGRRVVGAMMMQGLAAIGAGIGHLEVAPKHGALAAGGALMRRASEQRAEDRARARRSTLMLGDARRPNSVLHHTILV